MIYAVIQPDKNVRKIESWYVVEKYRQRGVGASLLTALENTLKDQHCRKLELKYIKPAEATEELAIEALLKKTHWDTPVPKNVIFRCRNGSIKHARWLEIATAFPSFQVFPWRDLADADVQQLQQGQAKSFWYPEDLSLFISDDLEFEIDPDVSIGLRYQDRLIQQTGKGIIL